VSTLNRISMSSGSDNASAVPDDGIDDDDNDDDEET
jgi:hypothetical protein